MNLREAAQRALEILEEIHPGNMTPLAEGAWNTAITALRAALAEDAMQRLTDVQQEMEYHFRDATKMMATINKMETVEPVAWKHDCAALCTNDVELWINRCPHCGKPCTAPPKRKPLTEAEITRLWVEAEPGPEAFARAIERAHGIGDEE